MYYINAATNIGNAKTLRHMTIYMLDLYHSTVIRWILCIDIYFSVAQKTRSTQKDETLNYLQLELIVDRSK